MLADDTDTTPPAGENQRAWYDLWGKLQDTVADLDNAVAALQARADYALSHPMLASEYQEQLDSVEAARDRAQWVRDTIKNALGAFGLQLSGLGGLGFIWIPITVAVAAVAWLGSKAADVWALTKKIDEQRRLEGQGLSPDQASAVISHTASAGTSPGLLQQLGGTIGTITVATIVGFGIWWFVKSRRRGRGVFGD